MKTFSKIFLVLIVVMFAVTAVFAARFEDLNVTKLRIGGTEVTATADELNKLDGATGTVRTSTTTREYEIWLPLTAFIISDTASPISVSTVPGLEIDDSIPSLVWADNEVTPVMTTFRVPTNYSSGGAFRIFCSGSGTSTPNQIDFDVYVNRSGVVFDASATGQTPVTVGVGTSATNAVVTLTPATDFDSLAAGDWVTVRIWRDNVATGTDDLEVKGVEFFYTGTN